MEGLEKRYPSQLSGGQQQRVALARIMAYQPSIIMLDEPFSALDSYLKDTLQQEMLEKMEDYPGDVILVSHSRDEIFKFSDRLMVMDQGKVVERGNTRDIFKNPTQLASARLTGCKNISPMRRISEHQLEALDWGMILQTEQPISAQVTHVGIRGHRLQVSQKKNEVNGMSIHLVRSMETPFEVQYIVRNKEYEQSRDLWWMERKSQFDPEKREEFPKELVFPPEKLILLEG